MFVGSVLSMGHDEFHIQIHTNQFLIEMQVKRYAKIYLLRLLHYYHA